MKFLQDSLALVSFNSCYFYRLINYFHHKTSIVFIFADNFRLGKTDVFFYFYIAREDKIVLFILLSIHINNNISHASSYSCWRCLWVMTGQLIQNLRKNLVNRFAQFLYQIIKFLLILFFKLFFYRTFDILL